MNRDENYFVVSQCFDAIIVGVSDVYTNRARLPLFWNSNIYGNNQKKTRLMLVEGIRSEVFFFLSGTLWLWMAYRDRCFISLNKRMLLQENCKFAILSLEFLISLSCCSKDIAKILKFWQLSYSDVVIFPSNLKLLRLCGRTDETVVKPKIFLTSL